jgi:ProP effector
VELERRRAIVQARKHAEREAARASRRPSPSQQAEVSPSAAEATGERPATRGARPMRPRNSDRTDRAAMSPQPGQAQRPPQPGGHPTRGRPRDTGSGAPRRPRDPQPEGKRAVAHQHEPVNAPALPLTSEQAAEAHARQQRALLLRSFEQSPLSKANFGALKGLSEGALDELLALARQERGSR